MKVTVSALGTLTQYVPGEIEITVKDASLSLKELICLETGVPENESRLCYVVNGRIQKGTYQPGENDKIVLLKMAGAG